MDKLVSIITPCYNGAKYLNRFMDSILSQTYPSIEFIFINDGSTDDTEAIALSYKPKFIEKGYSFTYIRQENAGQSAAINQGLKIFSGEYLTWPDSDDYLTEDSVAVRVSYLENHPDVGAVSGRVAVCESGEAKPDAILGTEYPTGTVASFYDTFRSDFCWCPLAFMVRSSMFRDSMPEPLCIQTPREVGQNCQLLWPIMYRYPLHYISHLSGFYVVHSDSHSHSINTFQKSWKALDVTAVVQGQIADDMETDACRNSRLKKDISAKILRDRLELLSLYHRKDNLKDIVSSLRTLGCYGPRERRLVLKIKYPYLKKLADRLWRRRHKQS